jgi:hypothetical protein
MRRALRTVLRAQSLVSSPRARSWLAVIADVPRTLMREAAARRQFVIARDEFARLDASAIRDLGMSRSEFSSYWAESHELAERTRVRVAQQTRRE